MIIICPSCNKQFRINPSLITAKGREVKCGSCDNVWFYQKENKILETLPLNQDVIDNKVKSVIKTIESESKNKIDDIDKKKYENQNNSKNKTKKNDSGKFFSYLIVFIISFVALIILLDTFKTPLINLFPVLELLLFNLFEALQDIKLFIIDLY